MVCQPGAHLDQKHWYRAEDSTGEVEMSRLHKFCDEVLPIKRGEESLLDRDAGKTRTVPSREFNECIHSMRKDIVERAMEVVKHFRAQAKDGRGKILPGVFAELEASLKGREQPAEKESLDDPDDSEELKRLREELAAKQKAEDEQGEE
jgi:hypothetical protein